MRKILLLLAVVFTFCVDAQNITNYAGANYSASSGTFTALSGGTTVPSLLADDVISSAIPIGFTFYYMGLPYTQVRAGSDGYITLSSSGGSSSVTNNLATGTTVTRPVIAPFWDDVDGRGTGAQASYLTSGSPGTRVFTFEWLNWVKSGGTTPQLSFQVNLYEGTGKIEFVYRSDAAALSGTPASSIGLSAIATGSGNFVSLNNATNTATTSTTSETTSIATKPATGQTYTFTPPAVAAPTTLTFTSVGLSTTTVGWTDNSTNENSFIVIRATDAAFTTNVVTSTVTSTTSAGTGTTYSSIQSGLAANTTYYYSVAAVAENASAGLTGNEITNSCAGGISGTKSVGPTGDFATITAALAGGISGATILELQSTYSSASETFPITIPACTNITNTLTIRPQTGATGLVITSNNITATVDLNGATYVTFDGRPGGVGTTSQLSITNTSTATGGTAVRFINDASNNTLRYLTLRSSFASTTAGVVVFFTTTGTTGNDNNTIDNCNIDGGAGATASPTTGVAQNGIYSLGTTTTTALNNSGNTISNCNIYDLYVTGAASVNTGILIAAGNTDWTLTGNSIYQTNTRTSTVGGATINGISISNSTSGNNFNVSNNYFGGNAPLAAGIMNIGGAFANRMVGITFTGATTTPSSFQNNVITGITLSTTSGATTAPGIFCGMYFTAGSYNVGNVTGNVIGSGTGTGSINVTTSTAAAVSYGIEIASGATCSVNNNTIGSLTFNGSTTSVGQLLYLINVASFTASSSLTISNNTLGSLTTANSVNLATAITGGTAINTIVGIRVVSSNPVCTFTNNTIANLNNASVGSNSSTAIRGIQIAANCATTITGNTIRNFTSPTINVGTTTSANLLGISTTSTNVLLSQSISNNTIHSLINTNTTAGVSVIGIVANWTNTATGLTCSGNLIHSLRTGGLVSSNIFGIYIGAGAATYANNMIRLGLDETGAALTIGQTYAGINEALGTNTIVHNSVYIGGTGVAAGTNNTYAFWAQQTSNTRVFRNNIFVNDRQNGAGTGLHLAAQYAGTFPNALGLTLNNNIYFARTAGNTIRQGSTNYTLNAWKNFSNADALSGVATDTTDINFVNARGAAGDLNLHVQGTTVAEGAGFAIATITTDFDGETRSGLTPVDIGADAGNFTAKDIFAPVINYTALLNSPTGSTRVLPSFATITDNVGVSTGANLPRLYYKKSTDADAFVGNTSVDNGWKYVVATNAVSPFDFTIDYTIINGGSVAAADVIQYFVVAQDDANNFSSHTIGATSSANPPVQNINGKATTPLSYTIASPITGPKTVGTGGDYTTLTGAGGLFEALNNGVIGANLEVNIVSDITEPGTNALNAISQDPPSSTFTVTIKPSAAVTRIISGAVANGMIRLNGADRVTIDGRFSGAGNFLTFRNTNTSNPTITLLNDATLNTIQYSTIEGATTTSTNGVVFLSTGATTGNDNNTISNNLIRDRSDAAGVPANLIFSQGTSPSIANGDNAIANNELFNFSATGVLVSSTGNSNNWNISNNSFYQTAARTTNLRAIQVAAGGGHTINSNSIGGANASRSGTAMTTSGNIFLIDVASVTSTPTTNIQGNNFGNIISTAFSIVQYCIGVAGTGNVNIGTTVANNIGGAIAGDITVANSLDGIYWSSTGTGDIRNNIIKNLTFNNPDFERLCGVTATAGTVTIKGNTINNLLHVGATTSSVATNNSLLGIYLWGSSNSLIENNTIYNLSLGFNGANQTTTNQLAGIQVDVSTGATINANRIYNLTTTRTGTGTNAPNISGICTGTTGSATYSNNQIVLNQSTASTQPLYKGIWMRSTSGNNNIWYNTVVVAGTAAATNNTYALLRDITSGSLSIRNNILHNERSGASSNNYSIGTVSSTGFTSTVTCNNNLYIAADLTKMGEFATGVNQTLAQWRTSGLGDLNSRSLINTTFGNTSYTDFTNGDLSILAASRKHVASRGAVVTTTGEYGLLVTRNTLFPGIGSVEYTGNIWNGAGTDWNTGSNWSLTSVPTVDDNVVIPLASGNQPNIASGTFAVNDLNMVSGSTLTIASGSLSVSSMLNNAGSSILGNGALVLNGTDEQIINGVISINNLTLNNASGATIAGGTTSITGTFTPTAGTLTTGGRLTLKSTATGTARVAQGTGTFITGNVNVERYFAGGAATGTPPTPGVRGFRFIAHPFTTNPFLNTLVAGGLSVTGTGGSANGFTNNPNLGATNSPSAFNYDPTVTGAGTITPGNGTDPGWTAYTNANTGLWNKMQGIRALFRGTNTQGLDGNNVYTVNPLTLTLTGAVNTGAQNFALPATADVVDPKWSLVGNPYPSQIEVRTLLFNKYNAGAGNIGAAAYVFNPTKSGTLRGGYDMIDVSTAGSYILPTCGVVLVQNTVNTTHNIPFAETDKSTGTPTLNFRTTSANNALVLTMKDVSGLELDNTYIRLNNNAANTFENRDGGKMLNDYAVYTLTPENTLLAIDSRPEPTVESIIPMGVQSATAQSFVLKATELALPTRIEAYLKDKFLNVTTPLSLGTEYSFSVDPSNAATLGNNRFEIVMRNNNALPATFLSVTAAQKNAGIEVSWTTANETNMSNYEVEESTDGNNFSKATSVAANNATTNVYNWLDASIINGDNYYRIKAVEKNGTTKYSNVVKVKIGGKGAGFTVYPNPVKGGVVSLQMSNVEKGIYTVKIYNNIGQELAAKAINHNGGSATQTIDLGKGIASGSYNMQITNGTTVITKTVIVE